jgi:hypothetical protein
MSFPPDWQRFHRLCRRGRLSPGNLLDPLREGTALRQLLFVKYTFALATDYERGRNPVKAQYPEFISCPASLRHTSRAVARRLLEEPVFSD